MIPVRVILGLLTFGMFFIYQISRFNINIAIVAITHSENDNVTNIEFDGKAIILGSFFYMSWVTELTGAYILTKFGCRYVMTAAFGLNALACFLFPWSYGLHPLCAAFVRVIQGLVLGTTWPAMAWLTSRWIPKVERSRFMSAYHGAAFGASFSNLLGGIVIDKFGWPYVFYRTGVLSIVWILFWWPCAYDSPALHPKISKEELDYLEENVETNTNATKTPRLTPWLDILTSLPFWSIFCMIFSLLWFVITLAMQMPTYFDMVHNLNIKTNGLLLSIPDIMKAIVGIYFPTVVDKLIKKNKITVLTARKLSAGIGCIIPGVILIFLGFFGHTSVPLAATLIILCLAINGAGSSSILANIVDISPNHAGIIMGIIKTAANLPGILSPIIVRYMLDENEDSWSAIFLITAIIIIVSNIFYLFFASSDIQPWNEKINIDGNVDMIEKSEEDVLEIDVRKKLYESNIENEKDVMLKEENN